MSGRLSINFRRCCYSFVLELRNLGAMMLKKLLSFCASAFILLLFDLSIL